MKHSSRRTSCPVCGRNTDDKCRWNDEVIFCYDGTSFAPPQFLRIGDKIKIQTENYALFSQSCGFANNSYGFALVDDFDYRFLKYEDKRQFRKECVRITREFIKKRDSLNAFLSAIKNEDYFHEMNLAEFNANKKFTEKAISLLASLSKYATANKRYVLDYLMQIKEIIESSQRMDENLSAIYSFERLHFE